MPNLLDLMTDGERKQVNQARQKATKISQSTFLVAKLGRYYGWQAIEAAKRGYVKKGDEKILLTIDEIATLVEAGEKIHAQEMLDIAHAVQAGAASAISKNPKKVFESATAGFQRRAKI